MNLKLIYFFSPDCSICSRQSQILEQIRIEQNLIIENNLITSSFDKALTYGVKSAPALVFLLDNRPYLIKTGFLAKSEIERMISELKQL